MRALVVYSSWFGYNRTIAKLIADELARRGMSASIISALHMNASDLRGYDLLVLGTGDYAGRARQRLRALCESIPRRQLEKLEIALYSTHVAERWPKRNQIDELQARLAERGCDLAIAPLRIVLPSAAGLRPGLSITAGEYARIADFVAELWEACVPAPMI